MLKVVKGVIQEPDDMEDSWIYAFSYYFDHAVEAGLVGERKKIAAFNYRALQINGALVDQVKVATVIEVNVACHLNKQVVTEQNGSVVVQMNREAQS